MDLLNLCLLILIGQLIKVIPLFLFCSVIFQCPFIRVGLSSPYRPLTNHHK